MLVVTMQTGMAAFALSLALAGDSNSMRWWVPLFGFQALYMVVFFKIIRPIMREVSDKKAADLDERQLAIRDRAHHHAYQILGTVVFSLAALPIAAALYAGMSLPISLTHWHLQGLFFFFMNLIISLPASVVAWMEPDPSLDDE